MNEENNLPRVTIDTNLVISGIISPNNAPSQLITAWTQGVFNWIMTEETFTELKDVLNRDLLKTKYCIDKQEKQDLLDSILVGAEFVSPIPFELLPIHCRDKKDDILLACALGGDCDYLVTGDEDLLVLNGQEEIGKLRIVKVAEFLEERG